MPWFQVDDSYHSHPSTLALSLAARGLWATAGSWCSERLTDVVPRHVLLSFGSTPELEAELRRHGVWKRVSGGYQFQQEGLCKLPAKSTVEHQRELATGRQSRWREKRRRRGVDGDVDASTPPSTLDPDPSPSGGSVVNHSNGHRRARAGPNLIDLIIEELHKATGRSVDEEWAAKTRDYILGGRTVADPAAYIRRVIRSEPDPRTRFLPLY